jgi:hypothetical protein
MYAYKDLLQLAGLTSRMYGLVAALHGVKAPDEAGSGDGESIVSQYQAMFINVLWLVVVLDGVDIVAPGEVGDVLVRNLNLRVERGEHLMITGPVSSIIDPCSTLLKSSNSEWSRENRYCTCTCWPLGGEWPCRRKRVVCHPPKGVYGSRNPQRPVRIN